MVKAKEVEGLDCEADAVEGMLLVLRTRFDEMYDLRGAALEGDGVEGVHDMRVASRRLRSAARDFQRLFGVEVIPKRRLKETVAALGEVRDQDVFIEALEKARAKAEAGTEAGVERLTGERRARRARAHARLEAFMPERRLAELREKFLSKLERVAGARAGVSFKRAGGEMLESRLKEFLDLSGKLHDPSNPEELHRLRIEAKRLRYALELFSQCFGGELEPFARQLAKLQTALGDLHDYDLWGADLRARLKRHRAVEKAAGAPAVASQVGQAADWLIDRFKEERDKSYEDALALWRDWESEGLFGRLSGLLKEARAER